MPMESLSQALLAPRQKKKKPASPFDTPNNTFGYNVGPIGETPVAMPATGTYAAGAGLQRARNESGLGTRLGYSPGRGQYISGAHAVSGGAPATIPAGQPYTKESPFRNEVDRNQRNYSLGTQTDHFALERARRGLSLNPDEQKSLQGQVAQNPGGLKALLMGSAVERKQQSQELLRQRGIARGDARATARNFNASMMPQNVRLANGQTVSTGGMPPAMAAFNSSQSPSLREALLYGGAGAANLNAQRGADTAMLQGKALDNQGNLERAKILAAAESGGAVPGAPGNGAGFTPEETAAMGTFSGSPELIAQFGRKNNWPPEKISAAIAEYGPGPIGGAIDSAVNWWNKPSASPSLLQGLKRGMPSRR
jgi:hypothetical protein